MSICKFIIIDFVSKDSREIWYGTRLLNSNCFDFHWNSENDLEFSNSKHFTVFSFEDQATCKSSHDSVQPFLTLFVFLFRCTFKKENRLLSVTVLLQSPSNYVSVSCTLLYFQSCGPWELYSVWWHIGWTKYFSFESLKLRLNTTPRLLEWPWVLWKMESWLFGLWTFIRENPILFDFPRLSAT